MFITLYGEDKMKDFGQAIGRILSGGEVIELIGDVGSGKTTLVKGIAVGLEITENVQSPSFTINRVYRGRDDLVLSHYDFYRLNDAGIMGAELQEVINDQKTITIVEWGGVVGGVLPTDRLTIRITSKTEDSRDLNVEGGGEFSKKIEEKLSDFAS